MTTTCKHCGHNHAAWMRLNDGMICGRCGNYERNRQIRPVNTRAGSQKRILRLYPDHPLKAG